MMKCAAALKGRQPAFVRQRGMNGIFFSWLFVFMVSVCFGGLLYMSLSELNPDWFAYKLIFETNGAWLGEQNRDPAFLLLTASLANFFGADGYESYRMVFAVFFMCFICLLAAGRVFKFEINRPKSDYLLLLLTLLYFGFTRFTIQIREGVAVSLAIIGLAFFAEGVMSSGDIRVPILSRNIKHVGSAVIRWGCLVLAGAMHSATLIVLLTMVVARWGRAHRGGRMRLIWTATLSIAVYLVLQLYIGGALMSAAEGAVGDRLVELRELSFLQVVLWIIYGAVCWVIYNFICYCVLLSTNNGEFFFFLRIFCGPVLISTYISVVLALLLGISPLLITSYVRLLHMELAISLVLLFVVGVRHWLLTFIGLFLVFDQVRSIVDSISIYYGVDLLW